MNKIIDVVDLCKTFYVDKRQINVLKNVNMTVYEGEMVAVMGPSGSGKTTLLYCMSSMDSITSGKAYFCSDDITNLNEKQLSDIRLNKMGFVFQQMYMLNNLSIMENILLPSYKKSNKKEKEQFAIELMRKLGIIEIANNGINEVSGGQLQRACICRSMINNPKVIFADEPTGALNRAYSDEVINSLKQLNQENTTIMLVTHDIKVASECSRVLYLIDGNIMGEYKFDKLSTDDLRQRERALNNWLIDMGW